MLLCTEVAEKRIALKLRRIVIKRQRTQRDGVIRIAYGAGASSACSLHFVNMSDTTHCHELRVPDETRSWRIVYRTDADAIVIAEVFAKTTPQTPDEIIRVCQQVLPSV